jgi:FixJ family two-component response regulator
MKAPAPTVFVVDDDPAIREALSSLIASAALRVETFASARDFLRHPRGEGPACLVLDVGMPDISGLELQRELSQVTSSQSPSSSSAAKALCPWRYRP